MKSITPLEAAPAPKSATCKPDSGRRGPERSAEKEKHRQTLRLRARPQTTIHRIPEEGSESESSSSDDEDDSTYSLESLVADGDVREREQPVDEEGEGFERRGHEGWRRRERGRGGEEARSFAGKRLGPPVLLQWESKAGDAEAQAAGGGARASARASAGSESSDSDPDHAAKRAQDTDEEDDQGVSVRRCEVEHPVCCRRLDAMPGIEIAGASRRVEEERGGKHG